MMRLTDSGRLIYDRPDRVAILESGIDADRRIEAAQQAGCSRAVVGTALSGKLTFHRALSLGRDLGLLSRPDAAEARERGLLR